MARLRVEVETLGDDRSMCCPYGFSTTERVCAKVQKEIHTHRGLWIVLGECFLIKWWLVGFSTVQGMEQPSRGNNEYTQGLSLLCGREVPYMGKGSSARMWG